MGVFRFKKFEVVNERSAMKVNTDGVLLGAAVTIMPDDRNFLDIGTGTGTIALMVAQRSFADAHDGIRIDAIDIDEPSASEAAMNFAQSPCGIVKLHMSRAGYPDSSAVAICRVTCKRTAVQNGAGGVSRVYSYSSAVASRGVSNEFGSVDICESGKFVIFNIVIYCNTASVSSCRVVLDNTVVKIKT